MEKGNFSNSKKKFIEKRVYSFTLSEIGLSGSDDYRLRYDMRGNYEYYHYEKDWYLDILNIKGFVGRFLYAKELGKRKGFSFSYKLKKDIMA